VTRAFVADASVAVGWVHPAQETAHTAAMLDAIADGAAIEVPALWPVEVANALAVLLRRRKLTEDERQAGLGWLRGLPVRVDHAPGWRQPVGVSTMQPSKPAGGLPCSSGR